MMYKKRKTKRRMELEAEVDQIRLQVKSKEEILLTGKPGSAYAQVVNDLNALRVKLKAKLDQLERVNTGKGDGVVMDMISLPKTARQ